MTGSAIRTSGMAWTRSRICSPKPVSPAVIWSWALPAMRLTVWLKAPSTVRLAVCMPVKTATPRTMPAAVRRERRRCLRAYCQLMRRRRIMERLRGGEERSHIGMSGRGGGIQKSAIWELEEPGQIEFGEFRGVKLVRFVIFKIAGGRNGRDLRESGCCRSFCMPNELRTIPGFKSTSLCFRSCSYRLSKASPAPHAPVDSSPQGLYAWPTHPIQEKQNQYDPLSSKNLRNLRTPHDCHHDRAR